MRSRWLWGTASLLLGLAAAPLPAATYVERSYDIAIRPDGRVEERSRISLRLDNPSDYAVWSKIPVFLDANRALRSLEAYAVTPGGKRIAVDRKSLDTVDLAGGGLTHTSGKARLVSFPVVPPGSVLTVASTIEEAPYFRADRLRLGSAIPTERLRVSVQGGGAAFRWRLAGARDGLSVEEIPGGLIVTASALPATDPPDLAPGDAGSAPALEYGWGPEKTWQEVGAWYAELLRPVPRQSAAVRAKARALTAGVAGKRERLAALLAFVAREVRYVAVEVGIGGYRPAAPDEVLDVQWGDCKGKALLLVDLLSEAGIEAYPALIFSSSDGRIDSDFPSPFQFNHVVVAVRAEGVARDRDPVSEGLLFVDPTDPTGSVGWLHPGVQDQDSLVALGSGAALVRTPLRYEMEARTLEVELTLASDGPARGQARLELSGQWGQAFKDAFSSLRPSESEEAVRRTLAARLPGAQIDSVSWSALPGEVPSAVVAARLHFDGLLQPAASPSSLILRLPGPETAPAPALMQDRAWPLVLTPTSDRTVWKIRLPAGAEGCRPQGDGEVAVATPAGTFHQKVAASAGVLSVEQRTDLKQRWIEPDRLGDIKEVALAERRTGKRSIRLDCGAPGG